MTRKEIAPGLYIESDPRPIHTYSEAIEILETQKPDYVDFFSDYLTLTDVIELADRFDYYITYSGAINVTRLSKQPDKSIVQVARNESDIERLLQ